MGTAFYIVSDEKHEAFELGKGHWSPLERKREELTDFQTLLFFVNVAIGTGTRIGGGSWDSYVETVACKLERFFADHPDWRMVDDATDDFWIAENENDFPENYGEKRDGFTKVYLQTGTRYERAS